MRRRVWAAAILVVAVQGCGDGSPSETPAVLAVSPLSVELTAETPGQFSLAAVPAGGRLTWEVTARPSWAEVTPSSGVVSGALTRVEVTAPGLAVAEPGTYTGTVEILSDGGVGMVALTAVVSASPEAVVTPAALEFGGDDDALTFTLENVGRGTLAWTLASVGGRLTFSATSGELATGASTTITATADRDGLPVGATADTVVVTSNAAGSPLRVPATITVDPEPLAEVAGGVTVYAGVDTASFVLSNPGTAPLTWSAATAGAGGALTLSPSSGVVAVEDSVRVTVTVDRAAEPGWGVVDSVTIVSDAELSPVVPVELSRWTRPWVLDHRVIDAEHSRATGRIVTVSADPARLSIIDPAARTVRHVALALPPAAVSVGPDGLFAAVAHNGQLSHVDLTEGTVLAVHAVSSDAIDVVLAGNGYAYVFPRTDQWEQIRTIELATGVETQSTNWFIRAGTVAKLHPSGEYIYGADRGVSPSDFEKYDIRSGPPTRMYDSPYHGDYAFSGDIWIADDGARLFARSGNVFRSSSAQSEDMLYAGVLPGVTYGLWVEHSSAAGRVLAFSASPWGGDVADVVHVFDDAYLNPLGTVALPTVDAGGEAWASEGRFVFAAADGGIFHALVRADPSSGMLLDWALVSAPGDAIP